MITEWEIDFLTTKEIITIFINRRDLGDINLELSTKEIIENLENKDSDWIHESESIKLDDIEDNTILECVWRII